MGHSINAAFVVSGVLLCTAAAAAGPVTELPLDRGFYVASDTSCAQASSATLLLVHREGINSSQSACSFLAIEETGRNTFVAKQSCQFSGLGEPEVSSVSYEILSRTRLKFANTDGWAGSARLCEQSSLPEPWATNDIQDLLD